MSTNYPKSFVERLADSVANSIDSKIIFADPIEKDGILIIPVSRVRYGFGAGVGRKKALGENEKAGRGAGGGVDAQPIGYIEIKNGKANFHPVRNPISLPAVIIASGFASLFVFRGLARLFRK